MVTTRGKKIKLNLDSSEGELDGERDDEGSAKPAPKRRRTKHSKSPDDDPAFNPGASFGKGKEKATTDPNQLITRRNGRGGKLRDLMNMPVDVFTEVCFYLGPYDLRRLALTSKRLWDILMTKGARHIWKAAVASIHDLPECPTDLNEPQYVCLLYSSECYTVGCTSRGIKTDWFHRVRFCTACHAENFWYNTPSQGLGLNQATLSQIMSYFDSSPVISWAKDSREAPPYYIEAIKKATREYETLSQEQAGDYLSRLKDMSAYQVQTGRAMLRWKENQIASRAVDIAAEKHARFESIKIKLFDLGWGAKDFPMSNKEFKNLVLKPQKLTPKIWQNIRPKLESLLETRRNGQLEMQRRQRQSQRETSIQKFYEKLSVEALNLPFRHDNLTSLLPELDEVFALPSIKLLLINDTKTVTEDQWTEVAPDARLFVLRWWRDCLKQLAARFEDGATASIKNTRTRSKATDPKAETLEAVSNEIEGLKAKFSYTISAFVCRSGCAGKVLWFPRVMSHVLSYHYYRDMDGVLNLMQPIRPDGQDLVKRLLKDLKLDPETAKGSHPAKDQSEKNLLCTRCDEKIATYMNFNQMIDHFLGAQRWFDTATEAIRKSPSSCYPSRTVKSELPKIINDHDWISRDALLVRQDDKKAKEAVWNLQSDFWKDLRLDSRSEVKRTCLLCPKSYAPCPCPTWRIELHIRQMHDKEPDLERDTVLGGSYPSNPCPF